MTRPKYKANYCNCNDCKMFRIWEEKNSQKEILLRESQIPRFTFERYVKELIEMLRSNQNDLNI